MSHDDIRAALAKATPGPWEARVLGSEGYAIDGSVDPSAASLRSRMPRRVARCGYLDWDTDKANAHLIANAPTWLAELLAEVDEARRELGDVHVSLYSEIAMLTARAEAAEQTIQRVRGLAEAWATQPNDYDEDTEQQIEDGRAILRALDGGEH